MLFTFKKNIAVLLVNILLSLPIITLAQTGTSSFKNLQFDGKNREYILYVPLSYDGTEEVPLVLNLHGYSSSMIEQVAYGDFRKIADTANFILAVPNGLEDELGQKRWNYFDPNGENDLGFLSFLIDEISQDYAINTHRVYSTGMSNGGFMSLNLACELSEKITAVASVTGTMLKIDEYTCFPTHPMPIMQIHGTSDLVVPYLGNFQFMSVEAVVNFWVNKGNCSTTPIVTQVPDINSFDNSTAEHYLYTDGDDGVTIEHYKVLNGGHTWPGTAHYLSTPNLGNTNLDFDASVEIWRFFSQYPKNNTSDVSTENEPKIEVWPNPTNEKINFTVDQQVNQFLIYDSQGRVVANFPPFSGNLSIHLSHPGMYFAKFEIHGKWYNRKLSVIQ